MKIKQSKLNLMMALITSLATALGAQVLETVSDSGASSRSYHENTLSNIDLNTSFKDNTPLIGSTFSGTSGLITIPTPDYQSQKVAVSYKKAYVKNRLRIGGSFVDAEKDEFIAALRYMIRPEWEISVNRYKYIRASKPRLTGLNFKNEHYGLGMKYTFAFEEKDVCMGFNFTPMTAEELNQADIEQIESLRNFYITMGEKIGKNLIGYANLSTAFTKKQKIDFGNGVVQKIDRKEMLIASIGLEYRLDNRFSVFGEAKFGNYRDIFKEDSVRYRINSGLRFGIENVHLEFLALNLTETKPTISLGGAVGF